MRYLEIVKPSTKHLSSDTDPREASAGESHRGGMKPAGSLKARISILLEPQDLTSWPSRRWHLSPQRSQ